MFTVCNCNLLKGGGVFSAGINRPVSDEDLGDEPYVYTLKQDYKYTVNTERIQRKCQYFVFTNGFSIERVAMEDEAQNGMILFSYDWIECVQFYKSQNSQKGK